MNQLRKRAKTSPVADTALFEKPDELTPEIALITEERKSILNLLLEQLGERCRSIPPDNERYGEAQYYLGHAALQLKNYDTAIAAFQAVLAAQDFKYQEKAEWNLLLAYVAAQRSSEPEFVALLDQVAASSEHSFGGQAGELKGKLGAVWRGF